MKITDYLFIPLFACGIILLYQANLISFEVGVVLLTSASIYQLFITQKKLLQSFDRQEKSFLHQLEGSKKDKHLIGRQLNTVFTNIPSPLALLDTYGNFLLYNESFNRFIKGEKRVSTYNDERIDESVRYFLKDSYLMEKQLVQTISYQGKDYQCISVPIHENKRYAGCLFVFQDITEAVERERMQKRFIADASHELKTPIAAIKGMIEILNRDDFDDEEIMVDFHRQIEKETSRLECIVKDLLQLSKLSTGQVILNKKRCNLGLLINSVINEIKSITSDEFVFKVQCEVSNDVFLDEEKIHQALANIVKNACIHSGADKITIKAKENPKEVVVSIEDNGCGIKKADLEHIFERFYRVDTHRARKNGGSGLGLSIVQSIVLAHQGQIEVNSEVNKGTCFILHFPKEIESMKL